MYQTVEEFAYATYNHVRPHSYNGYKTPLRSTVHLVTGTWHHSLFQDSEPEEGKQVDFFLPQILQKSLTTTHSPPFTEYLTLTTLSQDCTSSAVPLPGARHAKSACLAIPDLRPSREKRMPPL